MENENITTNNKPEVHLLSEGRMEKIENPQLQGAMGLHITTGLITYQKYGENKAMVIDPGLVADYEKYKEKLENLNISHVLVTHFHQDHVQALAKFPQGTQVFHYGQSSLLGSIEYGAKIYMEGFIEVPEIKFGLINNTHTKKDTIYIVDSANEGVVAFTGDLAFSMFDSIPKAAQETFDLEASSRPRERINVLRNFLQQHPEIEWFYLGHYHRKVSRAELEKYLGEWP